MDITPILDRLQPIPACGKRNWKAMLIGGAIGILIVLAPSVYSDSLLERPFEIPLTLLAVYYLGILLHELGHLAASLGAGFAFRQFAVGPFVLNMEAGGLRFHFAAARLLSGGQVMAVPESTERLRQRFFQFVAGGPAVTALLFAIPLALPWTLFTRCLFLLSLALAAGSWLPYTINGRSTDGKVLLALGRHGPAGERVATILYLAAIDTRGTAPRDWPAESVRTLGRDTGDSGYRELGRMFVYFHALDGGDEASIAQALERMLTLNSEIHADSRRAYFAEAAFVQGMFRKDALLARAWLEDACKVKGTLPKEDWDSAALAGIAFAEGDAAQSRAQLTRAIAMLDRQPGHSGSVAACRGRLAALLEQQEARCQGAVFEGL